MPNTEDGAVFRVAVLTISDAGYKGERKDTSGEVIVQMMSGPGYRLVRREIVPDESDMIAEKLSEWCDGGEVDVIVTTGGTGLGPRDVTPETVRRIVDIEVPGVGEAMRMGTLKHTPMAMLSRAVAGVRNGCLIVTLPGSPQGVRECLAVVAPVIPHALEMIRGWRGHPAH
jgi:molybdenum cofactor synthesis domain-containing protein